MCQLSQRAACEMHWFVAELINGIRRRPNGPSEIAVADRVESFGGVLERSFAAEAFSVATTGCDDCYGFSEIFRLCVPMKVQLRIRLTSPELS